MQVTSVSMKGIALNDKHLSLSTGAVALIRHRIIIRRKRTLYISALQMHESQLQRDVVKVKRARLVCQTSQTRQCLE
jgi:hypothetical protein